MNKYILMTSEDEDFCSETFIIIAQDIKDDMSQCIKNCTCKKNANLFNKAVSDLISSEEIIILASKFFRNNSGEISYFARIDEEYVDTSHSNLTILQREPFPITEIPNALITEFE